jgi:hypothetical protein
MPNASDSSGAFFIDLIPTKKVAQRATFYFPYDV